MPTLAAKRTSTLALLIVFVLAFALCAVAPVGAAYAATPAKVKVVSVTSPAPGQVKVKVKKAKRAKGYQYLASTSKRFDKAIRYDLESLKAKKAVATLKGLKEGATYYVKVRAYAGKKFGRWSAVKPVEVLASSASEGSTSGGSSAELDAARAEAQEARAEADAWKAQLDKANADLTSLSADNAKLKADLEAMRSENARLRNEVERLGGDPGPTEPQAGDGSRTNPFLAPSGVTLTGYDGTVEFKTVNVWRDEAAISKLTEFGALESSYYSPESMQKDLESKSLALIEYNAAIKSGYDDDGFPVRYLTVGYGGGAVLNADATANIECSEVGTSYLSQSGQFRLISDSSWKIYGAGTSIAGYLVLWVPKGTNAFVAKHTMGLSNSVWVKYII